MKRQPENRASAQTNFKMQMSISSHLYSDLLGATSPFTSVLVRCKLKTITQTEGCS